MTSNLVISSARAAMAYRLWAIGLGLVLLAGCATTPKATSDASGAQGPAAAEAPQTQDEPAQAELGTGDAAGEQAGAAEVDRAAIVAAIREALEARKASGEPAPPPRPRSSARAVPAIIDSSSVNARLKRAEPGAPYRDGATRKSEKDDGSSPQQLETIPQESTAPPAEPATPAPSQTPRAEPPTPAPSQTPPGEQGGGCHGSASVGLEPPPPDQPQPKLVVRDPKLVLDQVWAGQKAKFAFVIANEGEGPLRIHLTKT